MTVSVRPKYVTRSQGSVIVRHALQEGPVITVMTTAMTTTPSMVVRYVDMISPHHESQVVPIVYISSNNCDQQTLKVTLNKKPVAAMWL